MSEWKSIKVKKNVYDAIKRIGGGSISKALELIVKAQQRKIERKLGEINEIANEIVQLMFKHGLFSIKLAGFAIDSVELDGEYLNIKGNIRLYIPSEELRSKMYDLFKAKVEEQKIEEAIGVG